MSGLWISTNAPQPGDDEVDDGGVAGGADNDNGS